MPSYRAHASLDLSLVGVLVVCGSLALVARLGTSQLARAAAPFRVGSPTCTSAWRGHRVRWSAAAGRIPGLPSRPAWTLILPCGSHRRLAIFLPGGRHSGRRSGRGRRSARALCCGLATSSAIASAGRTCTLGLLGRIRRLCGRWSALGGRRAPSSAPSSASGAWPRTARPRTAPRAAAAAARSCGRPWAPRSPRGPPERRRGRRERLCRAPRAARPRPASSTRAASTRARDRGLP